MTAQGRTETGEHGQVSRIGPNAITRVAEALRAMEPSHTDDIFARAGLASYLSDPPSAMVDEMEVARLHLALREVLGPQRAANISREAGRLTGDYLLANRIPRLAQTILKLLPRPIAIRLFLLAIARHAWTFTGSGDFTYAFDRGLTLTISDSPLCRFIKSEEPVCEYFAATFARLFSEILRTDVHVEERMCRATQHGAPCSFTVTWEDSERGGPRKGEQR